MALREEYERQQAWRDWDGTLARLPLRSGMRVWDVGCGVGGAAARMAAQGVRVLALDADPEMLAAVRARGLAGLEVQELNLLEAAPDDDGPVDGLWCGFSMAYFVDAARALRRWTDDLRRLAPGAFVAVLEIERMFTGHAPLDPAARTALDGFETAMRAAGFYDFRMGGRIAAVLAELGLEVVHDAVAADVELCFQGPATAAVLHAWEQRFARLRGMQSLLGARFPEVRDAFLDCLRDPGHRAEGTVRFVVARRR